MGSDKKTTERVIEFSEDKEKKKEKHAPKAVKEETETESESDDSEEEMTSEDDDNDDEVSISTTEILGSDPLYTILSQFFTSKDGKNIADILEEINSKMKYLKVR